MKIAFSFLAFILSFVSCAAYSEALQGDHAREALERAGQMIVVTAADWTSRDAVLHRYGRSTQNSWIEVGPPVSVVVGKNGLAWGSGLHGSGAQGSGEKREGDGKAPAGVFSLGSAFGYAGSDTPFVKKLKMPYVQATGNMVCVDDPESLYYNHLMDSETVSGDQWKSAEKMLRKDQLYSWGLFVEHNIAPRAAGGGSCIFLHVWRGPGRPTVGCTALDVEKLKEILEWLDVKKKPVLVQLPAAIYTSKKREWQLP